MSTMTQSRKFPLAANKTGAQTLRFPHPPRVVSCAAIAGPMEGDGRFGQEFDVVLEDDLWGKDTWEQAERRMFEEAVQLALKKGNVPEAEADCLIGGDLLNQIISANFAARDLKMPFLGVYGACSTMAESLLLGSALISGGFLSCAACAVSSHFCTAERQYRMPLEMGTQRTPTAQRTVTGSACTVLAVCETNSQQSRVVVTSGTIGRVIDLGVCDVTNMGAAMAPAAADTICAHLADTGTRVEDYDLIVTGDLGSHGGELCRELCEKRGIRLGKRHFDCGERIFLPEQDVKAGGSGCGCSAVVLNSYLMNRLETGALKRILFLATGALLSVDSSQQGESIPGVAHAVVLERQGV